MSEDNSGNEPIIINLRDHTPMPRKYSKLFDAYSQNMHRFLTEIVATSPEQGHYLMTIQRCQN